MAGSVSGGCVEGDLFERALQVITDGQPLLVHYGIADEMAFEVGLSCGGSIEVFVERFQPDPAWESAGQALVKQRPCALAIALAPLSLQGRRLAFLADGALVGSLNPELDQAAAAAARKLLLKGGAEVLALPWQGEEAAIFLEAFPPPSHLLIVGATHVAMPLCHMAKTLGFRVSVIDARSTFATRERFPEADELLVAWPDEVLEKVPLDAYTYVVILTHDPKFDIPTLSRALRSEARYIGIMGSRGTHERRRRQLREMGYSEEEMARVRAPIGLDLGGRIPEEMALAILAEITATRHGQDTRPLSEKGGHIHARAEAHSGAASNLDRLAIRAAPSGASQGSEQREGA
jgi:xanthine dehydrogenase accessory factor